MSSLIHFILLLCSGPYPVVLPRFNLIRHCLLYLSFLFAMITGDREIAIS